MADMSVPVTAFTTPPPDSGEDGTMTVPEVKLVTRELRGRDVSLRAFTDAQFAQINHEASILQDPRSADERRQKAMSRLFRILQSMFVEEEDQDFAADLITDGLIDLPELFNMAIEVYVEVNEGKKPNRQVRRGGRPAARRK
jgi:hypothetical protein